MVLYYGRSIFFIKTVNKLIPKKSGKLVHGVISSRIKTDLEVRGLGRWFVKIR